MLPSLQHETQAADTTPSGAGDLVLVANAVGSDPAAVEELCRRLGCVPRMVQGLNARMNRPLGSEDLRDLCQEVLTLVWKKLPQFDGKSVFESWVLGIVRFELLNTARRTWRRHQDGGENDLEAAPNQVREPNVDPERISNALARISPDDARIIRLHLFDDHPFDEIAIRIGVSVSAAKNRYYRALQGLRVRLGELAPRSAP